MEDALKRLDKLAQEEGRTAIAENLRATHTVAENVRGATECALAVDVRVADVDERQCRREGGWCRWQSRSGDTLVVFRPQHRL